MNVCGKYICLNGKEEMWFTLYFSRILLSYAVQVKSRIYFLPVFDMTKKKKKKVTL